MRTLVRRAPPNSLLAAASRIHCRARSTLPSVPEPPLPSAVDANLDRTGAVSNLRDPFHSRKLQGKQGIFRGRDIVPMWIADMDFRCPQPIVDATVACAQRGIFGYTNCPPELTALTLERLATVYGCATEPQSDWLHWMPGLVPGLSHAVRVAKARGVAISGSVDAQTRIAVLTPAYPPFLGLPAYHHVSLDKVPLTVERDGSVGGLNFALDWGALEASLSHPETRLLLLCNPHNPTGRCWPEHELRRLAAMCVEHEVLLCSDEVWGELPLEPERAPFTSALALLEDVQGLRERLIILTSPSKCFNIATLDIALAVVPDSALRAELIAEGRDMAEITPFGYFAAEAAFGHRESEEWRTRVVAYLKANHEYAIARLSAVPGVHTTTPESSYLLWVDATEALPRVGATSAAAHLLEAGVGVSDAADFGAPPGCFRLNLACARHTLERGLARIVAALE